MTKPFPPEQPPRQSAAGAARSAVSALIRPVAGIAVVGALLLAAYWYVVVHKSDDDVKDSMPAAGKCFSWSDEDGAAQQPCTDRDAAYKSEATVASGDADAACDKAGTYVTFRVTVYRHSHHSDGTICAALNLKSGDCVSDPSAGSPEKIECAAAGSGDLRVVALRPVSSATEALSQDTARTLCPQTAKTFVPDAAGKQIVCLASAAG